MKKRQATEYILCLYISEPTSRSNLTITSLRQLIRESFRGIYKLEVYFIHQHLEKLEYDKILAKEDAINKLPFSLRRLVDDLLRERVLVVVELKERE